MLDDCMVADLSGLAAPGLYSPDQLLALQPVDGFGAAQQAKPIRVRRPAHEREIAQPMIYVRIIQVSASPSNVTCS